VNRTRRNRKNNGRKGGTGAQGSNEGVGKARGMTGSIDDSHQLTPFLSEVGKVGHGSWVKANAACACVPVPGGEECKRQSYGSQLLLSADPSVVQESAGMCWKMIGPM